MESLTGIIAIIAVFGLPLAIVIATFRHRERMALNTHPGSSDAEIESLSRIADILDQRVQVLERILDSEVPDWREDYEREYMAEKL